MTVPVNRKFIEEFEQKEKKAYSSCLGLLRARKVKKVEKDANSTIVRSIAMEDVRLAFNPIYTQTRDKS